MFERFRSALKRFPVLGSALYHIYMRLRYNDGIVVMVPQGLLQGLKIHRFIRTVNAEFASGRYEEHLQKLLQKELKPGDTFFDVGANGGFFSLLAARLVGSDGRVVAFEPHPETARQARRQLHLNRFQHAAVFQAAVADVIGFADFTDGDTSVVQRLQSLPGAETVAKHTVQVPTTTLDAAAMKFGTPSVIKIDVEGAEALVVAGAESLLKRSHPTLLMEIHSKELYGRLIPLLKSFGYGVFRMGGTPVKEDEYARFVVCKSSSTQLKFSGVRTA